MALTSRVLILRENMYFVEYVTPLDALFFTHLHVVVTVPMPEGLNNNIVLRSDVNII